MPDAQAILAPLKIPDYVKADAWDAYHQAANTDDLAARLKKLPLTDSVRADLWDAKQAQAPAPAVAAPAATAPQRSLGVTLLRAPDELLQGAGAGVVSTGLGAYNLARKIPVVGDALPAPSPDLVKAAQAPDSIAGGLGKFLEQGAEFAVPAGMAGKAVKGAGLAARALAQAGVGAGVSAVQSGGDPVSTVLGGALGGGAEVAGAAIGGVKGYLNQKFPSLANFSESFGGATPTQKARISKALPTLQKDGIVPPDSVHEMQDVVKGKLADLSEAYQNLDPAIKSREVDPSVVVDKLRQAQQQYMRRGVITDETAHAAIDKQIQVVKDIAKSDPWFGRSVVSEQSGAPSVVYKGMPVNDWRTGQPITTLKSTNGPWAGVFSSDPAVAARFADAVTNFTKPPTISQIMHAHLNIEKPFVIDAEGAPASSFQFDRPYDKFTPDTNHPEIKAAIQNPDYDGVIIRNTSDEGDVFVPKSASQIRPVETAPNKARLTLDDLIHLKQNANGRTTWNSPDTEKSLWKNIGDAYRTTADALAPETTPLNQDYQKYRDLEQIVDQNIERGKGTTPSGLDLLLKRAALHGTGAAAGGSLGGAIAGPPGMAVGALIGGIVGPKLGQAAAQALQNAVDAGAFQALAPARRQALLVAAKMGDNAGVLKLLGKATTQELVAGGAPNPGTP